VIYKEIKLVLFSLIALFAYACAREMAPQGGKKDVTPPKIVQSIPPNGSPNFNGDKFSLKFNEFVVLNKINEQLLISPPVKEMPDFKLKGKTLTVKFKEKLKPNTTYSVFFGDALVDLTEGNPIHSFTYIFSTGDHVDSLSMNGHVVDAFTLQPEDGVMVMLYRNNNDTIPLDSLPLSVPPYYLSKTDKNGDFQLKGLAGDRYLVFALSDMNSNYFYDQPSEAIAFIDSLVEPVYIAPVKIDTTVLSDTAAVEVESEIRITSDSLKLDTIALAGDNKPGIKLFMFEQPDTVQRLMEGKLISLNTIRFVFSNPADDVSIVAENYPQRDQWHVDRWSINHDTLWWYLHEPDLTVDTLNLLVRLGNDTLDNLFISTTPKQKGVNLRKKKDEKKKKRKNILKYSTNAKGSLSPVSTLKIKFNQPIQAILSDSILLIAGEDSVYAPPFKPIDSLHLQYIIPIKLEESLKYRLLFPDSCFIDWNGYFNKKDELKFSVKKISAYGTLTINLKPEQNGNFIFQLLNKKEDVIIEHKFNNDTTFLLPYLNPGNFLMKIVFDQNNNGKWDPGKYSKKLEPEGVTYYNKVINIRANWEIEESWHFTKPDRNPPPGKASKKKTRK